MSQADETLERIEQLLNRGDAGAADIRRELAIWRQARANRTEITRTVRFADEYLVRSSRQQVAAAAESALVGVFAGLVQDPTFAGTGIDISILRARDFRAHLEILEVTLSGDRGADWMDPGRQPQPQQRPLPSAMYDEAPELAPLPATTFTQLGIES